MITISHKSKQYLLRTLKVLIVAGIFRYIYIEVSDIDVRVVHQIKDRIQLPLAQLAPSLLVLLFLSIINWFFEVLKWKTAVSYLQHISLKTATIQSLASLTVSLLTPNRIGEYGAKALYFAPKYRKQIMGLNLFTNTAQLFATLVFGFIGFLFCNQRIDFNFSKIYIFLFLLGIVIVLVLGYAFRNKELIKRFSIRGLLCFLKKITLSIKMKVIAYAFIRYIIFSYLFYMLLIFFGAQHTLFETLPLIFMMYLLASIIPTIFLLDVIVKGGIALWLFTLAGFPQIPVLSTVFCMWVLNFMIPAAIGSWFVVTYKTPAL